MEGVPFAMMLLGEAVMRGLAEHRTRRNGNGRTVHVDGRACARWTRV
jgi:hypothetical protein